MNRTWLTLVTIGVVAVVVMVGWDVFLTVTGSKSDFAYNIVPMDSGLYGNLEQHLVSDPYYYRYLQTANPTSGSDTTGGVNLQGQQTPPTTQTTP